MVKNIVKGKHIFARKAKPATEADKQVVTDLIDTLRANREICVHSLWNNAVFFDNRDKWRVIMHTWH